MKIRVVAIVYSEACVAKQLSVSRTRSVNTFRYNNHAGHDQSRKQSSSCFPITQLFLLLIRCPLTGCFQNRF